MTLRKYCNLAFHHISKLRKYLYCLILISAFYIVYRLYVDRKSLVRFPKVLDNQWNLEISINSIEKFEDSGHGDEHFIILNDSSILPPSARIVAKKIFKDKPLIIWATEWHMTPIKDLRILLAPFGVTVLDYNLDPWRCQWHDCNAKKKLKILTSDNVLDADQTLASQFYEAYKNDDVMKSVDVIFCGYPASICEIYIPLNKSVLVLPSTRYDVGRYTVERWNKLNENLRILAQKPWNIFGGNNLYDARYLQYYTGIKVHHLPSVCDYTEAEYTNEINEFLVLRRRDKGFNTIFFDTFHNRSQEKGVKIKLNLITGYTYRDLAKYRGIIHVPYQISVMSIFEQYRMNIPMFFPSPELLARWQVDHYIMHERSFNGAFFNQRPKASIIPPHPSQVGVPDPKNEYDYESTLYWMKFADFYQVMPHCFIYESIDHLVDLLSTLDNATLFRASSKMRAYNVEFKMKILQTWKDILIDYKNKNENV